MRGECDCIRRSKHTRHYYIHFVLVSIAHQLTQWTPSLTRCSSVWVTIPNESWIIVFFASFFQCGPTPSFFGLSSRIRTVSCVAMCRCVFRATSVAVASLYTFTYVRFLLCASCVIRSLSISAILRPFNSLYFVYCSVFLAL